MGRSNLASAMADLRLTKSLILASASPRRARLLGELGMSEFSVRPLDVDESVPPRLAAADQPRYVAELKSQAADRYLTSDAVTLTADSLVVSAGRALGKPTDVEAARRTLRALCGSVHEVVSAFTLTTATAAGGARRTTRSVTTEVELAAATDAEIDYYLERSPPLDKAGAYGIQDWIGVAKAVRITGSYSNVVGLPTAELYATLRELGLVDLG